MSHIPHCLWFEGSGVAAGLAWGCVPTVLTHHLSPQLDPQAVQTKNWHMDVIEMNGVSPSLRLQLLLQGCFMWQWR